MRALRWRIMKFSFLVRVHTSLIFELCYGSLQLLLMTTVSSMYILAGKLYSLILLSFYCNQATQAATAYFGFIAAAADVEAPPLLQMSNRKSRASLGLSGQPPFLF